MTNNLSVYINDDINKSSRKVLETQLLSSLRVCVIKPNRVQFIPIQINRSSAIRRNISNSENESDESQQLLPNEYSDTMLNLETSEDEYADEMNLRSFHRLRKLLAENCSACTSFEKRGGKRRVMHDRHQEIIVEYQTKSPAEWSRSLIRKSKIISHSTSDDLANPQVFLSAIFERNHIVPFLQEPKETHPRRSNQIKSKEKNLMKLFTSSFLRNRFKRSRKRNMKQDNNTSVMISKNVKPSTRKRTRKIILRSINSMKRLINIHDRTMITVLEEYLSEIFEYAVEVLLRRNPFIDRERDSPIGERRLSKLEGFLQVENPYQFYIYPSIVNNHVNRSRQQNYLSECGDEQQPGENMRCNCRKKGASCHCTPFKFEEVDAEKGKCVCVKGEKTTCDCYKAVQNMKQGNTEKGLFEISNLKRCNAYECDGQSSVQKKIGHTLVSPFENSEMDSTASTLTSGNELFRTSIRSDHRYKALTMGDDNEPKCCSCAKRRKKPKSRSRSRIKTSKSKQKCDCIEPCEPKRISHEKDQIKKKSCQCSAKPAQKICYPINAPTKPKSHCPCPCRNLIEMQVSNNTEHKLPKNCVCKPNSNIMKNNAVKCINSETCGQIDDVAEIISNELHKCNICKLIEDLGNYPDQCASCATFTPDRIKQLIAVLKETKDEKTHNSDSCKMPQKIKCIRNSSGIICQSEINNCPNEESHGQADRTNIIEIRIKCPKHKTENNYNNFANTCTSIQHPSGYGIENSNSEDLDCCKFINNFDDPIASVCTKKTESEFSVLLESMARQLPMVCRTTQCSRSNSNIDDILRFFEKDVSCSVSNLDEPKVSCLKKQPTIFSKTCTFKAREKLSDDCKFEYDLNENICEDVKITSISERPVKKNCAELTTTSTSDTCIDTTKDLKCIFRREKVCPFFDELDPDDTKRTSSDTLEHWSHSGSRNVEQDEIFCNKESCTRLKDSEPAKVIEKNPCEVKGSCVRQKLLEILCPQSKELCRIPSKYMPAEIPFNTRISTLGENSSHKDVMSKLSFKNSSHLDKPTCSKDKYHSKKRETTFKLDQFDQNVLSHALDVFLYSKGF
ncbi:hypothetical protein HHI36_014734 [Cryptolaemus montrouzieri]|uniref:Uncharacterized protein n=1 Tax=Cryptolaemus montrouzieri TaxID=559131 RepID=A0ABD2N3Q1_9CUCU